MHTVAVGGMAPQPATLPLHPARWSPAPPGRHISPGLWCLAWSDAQWGPKYYERTRRVKSHHWGLSYCGFQGTCSRQLFCPSLASPLPPRKLLLAQLFQ